MFLFEELVLPIVAHEDDAPDSAEGAGLGLLGPGTKTAELGCICVGCVRIGSIGDVTVSLAERTGRSSERKIWGNLTTDVTLSAAGSTWH